MSNLLLLAACPVAGLLLRRFGRVPADAHAALNAVIVHLSLPAVILHTLHSFVFDETQLLPVLMPWALFGIGALLFHFIGRLLGLQRAPTRRTALGGGGRADDRGHAAQLRLRLHPAAWVVRMESGASSRCWPRVQADEVRGHGRLDTTAILPEGTGTHQRFAVALLASHVIQARVRTPQILRGLPDTESQEKGWFERVAQTA